MTKFCRTALAAALYLFAGLAANHRADARVVLSLLEERHADVVVQQWDISCGAAALATLLTYQLGDPVSERDIARDMLTHTNINLVRAHLGFSLLDLKQDAERRGFEADGYGDVAFRDLVQFGPAIVPVVLRGFNHFVVYRGIQGDRVLLADPAWGNRTMQIPYFLQIWQSRVAFVVTRHGQIPALAGRLLTRPSDFWASSTSFESPTARAEVAKLLEPEAQPSVSVARASDPVALQQAAGGAPAGGNVSSSLATATRSPGDEDSGNFFQGIAHALASLIHLFGL